MTLTSSVRELTDQCRCRQYNHRVVFAVTRHKNIHNKYLSPRPRPYGTYKSLSNRYYFTLGTSVILPASGRVTDAARAYKSTKYLYS